MRKRQPLFTPLEKTEDSHPGITYLLESISIFKEWQASRNSGLSHETFMAYIQTMGAVISLTEYLTTKHGAQYLLSGKLVSDPIKARFRIYSQSSGGNFFMSLKQLLQAEKKIRCLSLLQQNILCTASRFDDLEGLPGDDVSSPGKSSEGCDDMSAHPSEDYKWLSAFLTNAAIDDLSDNAAAVAYYVSGYIGRAITCRRHYSVYKSLLVLNTDASPLFDSIPDKYKTVLEMANRGGLSELTELCFALTTLAVQYYSDVAGNSDLMRKLLCCQNQRDIFIKAVRDVVEASRVLRGLLSVKCDNSHDSFDAILKSAFNCFAKKEMKRMNSKPVPEELPAKKL